MILDEISSEIRIDEIITDCSSPSIYFITHLYCNETISFPKNWNSLVYSYVYTTEFISNTLYAYLGDKDKFRILDTVKPMNIVLSNNTHFKVTTIIDSGINRNCALLFEYNGKSYFYNGLFKSFKKLHDVQLPNQIDILFIDMTLIELQEEISPLKLNKRISELLKDGTKKIRILIPLFGFEILIFNALKEYKDFVTFDENFKKILKYTTIAQRFKINENSSRDIEIHVTNTLDYEKNNRDCEQRTIKVIEGYSSNIESFIPNMEILTWSVLPIGPDIKTLISILRPLSKKSLHEDYFAHSSLSTDDFPTYNELPHRRHFTLQPLQKVTRVSRRSSNHEIANVYSQSKNVESANSGEVNESLQDDSSFDFDQYVLKHPVPQKINMIKDMLNNYYPGFLDTILSEEDSDTGNVSKTPENTSMAFENVIKTNPYQKENFVKDLLNKFSPGFLEIELTKEPEKEEDSVIISKDNREETSFGRVLLPKMPEEVRRLSASIRIRSESKDSEESVASNDSNVTVVENRLRELPEAVPKKKAPFKLSQDFRKRPNLVYEEFSDSEL